VRKVIVSEMVSLDGFFGGPNGDIDWHVVDEDFNDFAIAQLNELDVLLFGRVTYQLMASYWPTDAALQDDPEVANKMNTLSKVVFSNTLETVTWGTWDNVQLAKGDIGLEVTRLKQQPGKDMAIFGSGSIVTALAQLGLIDEYRLTVAPVVLGRGMPLFAGITAPIKLKLLQAKTFKTGVELLYYAPDGK
jgi:dihydrofolate reductase